MSGQNVGATLNMELTPSGLSVSGAAVPSS